MKKPKANAKRTKTPAEDRSGFPINFSEKDALQALKTGLRIYGGDPENILMASPYFYHATIQAFFKWIANEILENENQLAVNKLHYLSVAAVKTLHEVCFARPQLFQPIAMHALYWPSLIGKLPDLGEQNSELMKLLKLSETAPLNTLRDGRKSFSTLKSIETKIAVITWCILEKHRREMQKIGDPIRLSLEPLIRRRFYGDNWDIELSKDQKQILKTLGPLSRKNFKAWWECGKPVFIAAYGNDFENHKDFSGYWKNAAFKGVPKARAQIRNLIRKQIKQGFRSIAPKLSAVE